MNSFARYAAINGEWQPVTNQRDFTINCACCSELVLQKTTNYQWAQGSYFLTSQTNGGHAVYKHETEDVYIYWQGWHFIWYEVWWRFRRGMKIGICGSSWTACMPDSMRKAETHTAHQMLSGKRWLTEHGLVLPATIFKHCPQDLSAQWLVNMCGLDAVHHFEYYSNNYNCNNSIDNSNNQLGRVLWVPNTRLSVLVHSGNTTSRFWHIWTRLGVHHRQAAVFFCRRVKTESTVLLDSAVTSTVKLPDNTLDGSVHASTWSRLWRHRSL